MQSQKVLFIFVAINASNHFLCDEMETDNHFYSENLHHPSQPASVPSDQAEVLGFYSLKQARTLAKNLKREIRATCSKIDEITNIFWHGLYTLNPNEVTKSKIFKIYIDQGKAINAVCVSFIDNVNTHFIFRQNDTKKTLHPSERIYTDHFYNLCAIFRLSVSSYYQNYCCHMWRIFSDETIILDSSNDKVLEKLILFKNDLSMAQETVLHELFISTTNEIFYSKKCNINTVNQEHMAILSRIKTIRKNCIENNTSDAHSTVKKSVDAVHRFNNIYTHSVARAHGNYLNCFSIYKNLEMQRSTIEAIKGKSITNDQHSEFSGYLCKLSEIYSQKGDLVNAYIALALLQRELHDAKAIEFVNTLANRMVRFILIDSTLSTVMRNIAHKYKSLIRNSDFDKIVALNILGRAKAWLNLLENCAISVIRTFKNNDLRLEDHLEIDKYVKELTADSNACNVSEETGDGQNTLYNVTAPGLSVRCNASVDTHAFNHTTSQIKALDAESINFLYFGSAADTYKGL